MRRGSMGVRPGGSLSESPRTSSAPRNGRGGGYPKKVRNNPVDYARPGKKTARRGAAWRAGGGGGPAKTPGEIRGSARF
jgi:hypothetical protein